MTPKNPKRSRVAAPPKVEGVKKFQPSARERDLLTALNKDGGAPAQLLGCDALALKIRGVISTQCPTIDGAIGRGGIPLGRLTLLHGKEGCGKTTLALHCVAEAQRLGGMCVYADAEHKLDPDLAAKCGVNLNELVITQPDYLEKFLSTIEGTISVANKYRDEGQGFPVLVVLDSINGLPTKAEFEAGWEGQTMGSAASVYSSKLKLLVPMINSADVALLLISQEREKIGVLYGRKEQTGGGKAPRYFSSLVMEMSKKGQVKADKEEIIGDEVEVKCVKNQIAPPFRKAEFRIIYGKGIDYDDSLMREAIRKGVIERSGAWYSFVGGSIGAKDERIGQGEEKGRERIASDPEFKNKMKEAIKT